jgi:hypothetical protein
MENIVVDEEESRSRTNKSTGFRKKHSFWWKVDEFRQKEVFLVNKTLSVKLRSSDLLCTEFKLIIYRAPIYFTQDQNY